MSEEQPRPNRLINETSPYLLQHAYNPVDWYPWSQEALDKAKQENRLILLSIGYSACHWCHVMERESFEDKATADYMNDNFVCIKVDREERPDLDTIYQTAHQIFNQRPGGWPLTAFLTPDERAPLFVGTYFPNEETHYMPSFGQIMNKIALRFEDAGDKIRDHNSFMKDAFKKLRLVTSEVEFPIDDTLMDTGVKDLLKEYDPIHGGFGGAPKFPHPTQLQILLTYWQERFQDVLFRDRTLSVVAHTLEAMSNGGLYDHLGGGFYRYSVDVKWEIPHFEKMLYDNAQLIPLYVDVGLTAENSELLETAIQTGEWAMRDMQAEDGGYYSTLDADSEGEEGKFYTWTMDELNEALTYEQFKAVEVRFGLRGEPNFEGKWHLRNAVSMDLIAERSGLPPSEVRSVIDQALIRLYGVRQKRVAPDRDEKILVSWNGLMIKALANAGRMLGKTDFIESAERSLQFIRSRMWRNGRLLATAKDDRAHLNAYLDDYAFLADGILELLQVRWCSEEFEMAVALVDVLLDHFVDEESGALFFTSDDHETLITRSIPSHDEATPSGNGVAAQVLLKMAYLLGEQRYRKAAHKIMKALLPSAMHMPSAFGSTIVAMERLMNPGTFIVIRGEQAEASRWAQECTDAGPVSLMVFAIPSDEDNLPGLLAEKSAADSSCVAYVCSGFKCLPPLDSLEKLLEQIPQRRTKSKSGA